MIIKKRVSPWELLCKFKGKPYTDIVKFCKDNRLEQQFDYTVNTQIFPDGCEGIDDFKNWCRDEAMKELQKLPSID